MFPLFLRARRIRNPGLRPSPQRRLLRAGAVAAQDRGRASRRNAAISSSPWPRGRRSARGPDRGDVNSQFHLLPAPPREPPKGAPRGDLNSQLHLLPYGTVAQ